MTEADRGCQTGCVYAANIFSPDGDGINDYWVFRQAFVSEYSIYVYNKWDQLIYSDLDHSIYSNGAVRSWDGTGGYTTGTYRVLLVTKDCNGQTNSKPHYVYTNYGTKSADINNVETSIIDGAKIGDKEQKLKVYPNPFTDNIIINYSGNIFPLKYKITDLNGKVIINKKTTSSNELVNLNGVAAGAYIFNAKARDYNLVQKLIKK